MNEKLMHTRRTFGVQMPHVDLSSLKGYLVAFEGIPGSGCRTQVERVIAWLEGNGRSVIDLHLDVSELTNPELEKGLQSGDISLRSLFLLRATALFDQVEKVAIPALHAGCIVLANRYVFSLMAQGIEQGALPQWVKTVLSPALVPHQVFFLSVDVETAARRVLERDGMLGDAFFGFRSSRAGNEYAQYVERLRELEGIFWGMAPVYQFHTILTDREQDEITQELGTLILTDAT